MSVIDRGLNPKFLWPGINDTWGTSYTYPQKYYSQCLNVVNSEKAYEEYVQVTGFPTIGVKPSGSPVTFKTESQGFIARITNSTYAGGFAVTLEERMDNLYPKMANQRTARLARSLVDAQENSAAGLFNRAFTAGFVGADGVVLGSSAHLNYTGGTYQNRPTTDQDLSRKALEDLCILIERATDDTGKVIGLKPHKLVVPPNEKFNADRILMSGSEPDTANNAINPIRRMGLFPGGYVSNPFITLLHSYFVLTEGHGANGLIFQERMEPETEWDNDFTTKNMLFTVMARWGVGWDDPRAVYCVNRA